MAQGCLPRDKRETRERDWIKTSKIQERDGAMDDCLIYTNNLARERDRESQRMLENKLEKIREKKATYIDRETESSQREIWILWTDFLTD